jgi:hypothetical protein
VQIGQLFKIFEVLGTPTDNVWGGVTDMPDWQAHFPQWPPQDLAQVPPHTLPLADSKKKKDENIQKRGPTLTPKWQIPG